MLSGASPPLCASVLGLGPSLRDVFPPLIKHFKQDIVRKSMDDAPLIPPPRNVDQGRTRAHDGQWG